MPLSEEHKEKMRVAREAALAARIAAGLPPHRKYHRAEARRASAEESPRANFADTPEFQAAVAARVEEQIKAALPKITESIAAVVRPAPAVEGNAYGIDSVLAKLAAQIAELTDQGSSAPKRIPPEILLARRNAHERMLKLIDKESRARRRDPGHEPPIFHLTSKIVARIDDAGEQLIEPLWRGADNRTYPTELGWLGIPNLAMEPQNASAVAIMDAFKESIGNKSATAFKVEDKEPDPDQYIETNFGITEQGRLVTGSGVQHRKTELGLTETVSHASIIGRPDADRLGPGYQMGVGVLLNKGASLRQQQGAAPYKDVRVLGSIAPPARQNG